MRQKIRFTSGSLLLALLVSQAQAQTGTVPATLPDQVMVNKNKSAAERTQFHIQEQQQKARSTAKTTSTASRLIASSTYFTNDGSAFTLGDTFRYSYTGTRGGAPGMPMNFDISQRWAYNYGTSSLQNDQKVLHTFDASDRVISEIQQLWDAAASSWVNSNRTNYVYNAAGKVTMQTYQTWDPSSSSWDNLGRYNITYDALNNVTEIIQQGWNSGTMTWDNQYRSANSYLAGTSLIETYLYQSWNKTLAAWQNSSRYVNTYNAKNKTASYTTQHYALASSSWQNDNRSLYTYDASDTLVVAETAQDWSGSWTDNNKYVYTYDASGRQLNMLSQYWDAASSAWINSMSESLTYDAAGNNNTDISQMWDDGSSSWTNYGANFMSFDAAHNNIQSIIASWDHTNSRWDSSDRTRDTYNGYNQITSSITDQWTGADWEFTAVNTKGYYYYEAYAPTGISTAANQGGMARIFPVPASQSITIDLKWEEAQAFSAAIYDMQGRVWQQWRLSSGTSYHETIAVNELPAGNYIIQFNGDHKGRIVQQLTIVR